MKLSKWAGVIVTLLGIGVLITRPYLVPEAVGISYILLGLSKVMDNTVRGKQ